MKVVSYSDRAGYGTSAKGWHEIGDYEFRKVSKLTVAAHKAHPCHAATVSPYDGHVVYVCTNLASHKKGATTDPAVAKSEKEERAKERAAEHAKTLRAREKNIQLGALLEEKLAAPAIDGDNMRLLAELLVLHDGDGIAQCGLRYTDDDSQTVIEKKDGTISRIEHVDHRRAKELLVDRLNQAKTAEEIMGVLLQALIAARLADVNAVPQSQRWGAARGISRGWGQAPLGVAVEKLAAKYGIVAKKTRARTKAAA